MLPGDHFRIKKKSFPPQRNTHKAIIELYNSLPWDMVYYNKVQTGISNSDIKDHANPFLKCHSPS